VNISQLKLRSEKFDDDDNNNNNNNFKITLTIPEQHSGKVRNQGATENCHIGHCTHTVGKC